jgi:hypothetical protein
VATAPTAPQDFRDEETQRKCMDLRRPQTKLKFLKSIFDAIDADHTNDGHISKAELVLALRKNGNNMLRQHFPKHANEVVRQLEMVETESLLGWDEFSAAAMEALSVPGGR